MTALPSEDLTGGPGSTVIIHPLVVRICHWVGALAVLILISSGWRIFDEEPLPGLEWLHFPEWISLPGPRENTLRVYNDIGLAGALLWHFAAMWLLFASLAVYVVYGLASGHFRRGFFPVGIGAIVADTRRALTGRLDHALGARNAVQKLLYLVAVIAMVVMALSGLALWKPVQLRELSLLFGGYEASRYVHFFGMTTLVGFIVVHVALTALVPKVLPPMITGRVRRSALVTDRREHPDAG